MKKRLGGIVVTSALFFASHVAFAGTLGLVGKFYDITPKRAGVTEEYCKTHVLDTYKTSPGEVDKEVVGENGIKARDLGYKTKQVGGIFFRNGTVMFTGTTDGKQWREKVYYFSHALSKESVIQQGAWYTKDCKGFYSVRPDEQTGQ